MYLMNIKNMKKMKNRLSFLFLFAIALIFSACEEKAWHQDDLELSPVVEFIFTDYNISSSGVEYTYHIYTDFDYYIVESNSLYYKYEYTDYTFDYTEVYTELTEEELAAGEEASLSSATYTVTFNGTISSTETCYYEFTYETVKKKGTYTIYTYEDGVQSSLIIGTTTSYETTSEYIDPNFVTPVVES